MLINIYSYYSYSPVTFAAETRWMMAFIVLLYCRLPRSQLKEEKAISKRVQSLLISGEKLNRINMKFKPNSAAKILGRTGTKLCVYFWPVSDLLTDNATISGDALSLCQKEELQSGEKKNERVSFYSFNRAVLRFSKCSKIKKSGSSISFFLFFLFFEWVNQFCTF